MKVTKDKKMKRGRTNPYNVNQHTLPDPRQSTFLALYLDPKSETFSNALQSALNSGYEREYAESITAKMPAWLAEAVGEKSEMLDLAERNLKETLELPQKTHAMGAFGPLYEKGKKKGKKIPIMAYNASLIKYRLDAAKFIAERIGKDKYRPTPSTIVPVQINFGGDKKQYA